MFADLKYAFRQLGRSPAFTVATLLTLALGIGACTAIFSVVDSVLLSPLAFPSSNRLVHFWETKLPDFPDFLVAPGQYFTWKEQAKSFERFAARRFETLTLTGNGEPRRVAAAKVTANYFATFGIYPAVGREFRAEENLPGQGNEVILSDRLWKAQFGGQSDVLNHSIRLNGEPYKVIGVMPAKFRDDALSDIFVPLTLTDADKENRGYHSLNVVGRLRPGVSLEQARTEMLLLSQQLELQFPQTRKGWSVGLLPLREDLVSEVRPLLVTLLGAVGFLLLIGCVNVANLLLARAVTRSKEIAIRVAQGATRARIVRQLLTESLVLGALGGSLGVALAHWLVEFLVWLAPGGLPRSEEIQVNGHALAAACGLILFTSLFFGLAPALQASRVDLNRALKDSGRGLSLGGPRQRLLSSLVVTEIALSVLLLVGAGLLIRSFARLHELTPGFEPHRAFALELNLFPGKYATKAQQSTFADQVAARLAALPGVESAGAVHLLPFTGKNHVLAFYLSDHHSMVSSEWPIAHYFSITPDYLNAMGIPLRSGRAFNAGDVAGAKRVALISESFAKRYFPDRDPIGKQINILSVLGENWREIVGVVGDTKKRRLDEESTPQMYEPFYQLPYNFMTFVVRMIDQTPPQLSSVRAALDGVDKDQPISSLEPMDGLIAESLAQPRFSMQLVTAFSAAALLLAMIGIYGVMTYAVGRRTGEIGIRIALGAQRKDVFKMIFLQGGRLVFAGLSLGLLGALFLTRLIASQLYSVSAYDPLTFLATALLLITFAALACFLPARRATRINPLTALQTE